jgi:hypothetical protein
LKFRCTSIFIVLLCLVLITSALGLGTGGRTTSTTSAQTTTAWTWIGTSLTTGNLFKLICSDTALNGGKYINLFGGAYADTSVFSIGEGGAVTIVPSGGGITVPGILVTGTAQTSGDGLKITKKDTTNTTGKFINCLGGTGSTEQFTVAEGGNTAITQTATTGNGLSVTRNLDATSTNDAVFKILQDSATDDQPTVYVKQDGSGNIVTGIGASAAEVFSVTKDGNITGAGQTFLARTGKKVTIIGAAKTDFDAQNATLTIAGLLGGIVTQNSKTGASTATTPTGTEISAGITGVATGDSFTCVFYNRGNQTTTITAGASGVTVLGTAAVPTLKTAMLFFLCTGANTWEVYVTVSA